jgi:NodT family efflux transporter outer membrane factor (OMF) lipoprotein
VSKRRWRAPAIALAAVLAGCATPPNVRPALQPVTAETLGLSDVSAPKTSAGWWRAYGDPQLNDLVERTLRDNPSFAQALSRIHAAEAQVQAATAASRPGVTLQGQEQRQRFPEKFIYPPPFGGGLYWQGTLTANLSWDLDFWGRQAALIRQAEMETQAAQLDAAAAQLALSGALAEVYADFNRTSALADIAAQSEQQRQKIFDITRKRVAAGLDTDIELREAEAAVPRARYERLQAQANAELAVHRLAALAGEGAQAYTGIHRPQVDLEAALPLPERLPADLLGRRPDILAARARVEAATQGRAAAKKAFYPDVNLNAFAGFEAIGLGNLLQAPDATYGAGPALSLPLFRSGVLQSRYRSAVAAEDEAIATYNDTVLRAVQEVADQLSLLRSQGQQLQEVRATLTAAEAAYRLAEKRYNAGLTSYLSVLTAETQVLDARTLYVNLLSAQATSRVALLLDVGGSFDPATLSSPAVSSSAPEVSPP